MACCNDFENEPSLNLTIHVPGSVYFTMGEDGTYRPTHVRVWDTEADIDAVPKVYCAHCGEAVGDELRSAAVASWLDDDLDWPGWEFGA